MARKTKNNITEVLFSYVGTDAQFNEFLKQIIQDYLPVDDFCCVPKAEIVTSVDSEET